MQHADLLAIGHVQVLQQPRQRAGAVTASADDHHPGGLPGLLVLEMPDHFLVTGIGLHLRVEMGLPVIDRMEQVAALAGVEPALLAQPLIGGTEPDVVEVGLAVEGIADHVVAGETAGAHGAAGEHQRLVGGPVAVPAAVERPPAFGAELAAQCADAVAGGQRLGAVELRVEGLFVEEDAVVDVLHPVD